MANDKRARDAEGDKERARNEARRAQSYPTLSARDEIDLPPSILHATQAALVSLNYRPQDVVRGGYELAATRRADTFRPAQFFFRLLKQHLESSGAKPYKTEIQSCGRTVEINRWGKSNVIQVARLGNKLVLATVLSDGGIAFQLDVLRRDYYARLTRGPVANTNAPAHESPGMRTRVRLPRAKVGG